MMHNVVEVVEKWCIKFTKSPLFLCRSSCCVMESEPDSPHKISIGCNWRPICSFLFQIVFLQLYIVICITPVILGVDKMWLHTEHWTKANKCILSPYTRTQTPNQLYRRTEKQKVMFLSCSWAANVMRYSFSLQRSVVAPKEKSDRYLIVRILNWSTRLPTTSLSSLYDELWNALVKCTNVDRLRHP